MAGESLLIKAGLSRSVRLERRGELGVIVKRFEQRGVFARARGERRARREFELLSQLFTSGVEVPRPLAFVRRGSGFEVEIEWIAGARSLAEVCREGERLPVALAQSLGRLLAALHSHGVDHPDLHAGNVLVADAQRVVAVDFDKARKLKQLGAAQIDRDLVHLCAGLRESTHWRWRALAFEAWWDALDPRTRESLKRPETSEIESRARERRRRVVEGRARRWTRASSSVGVLEGGRGFARAKSDAAEIASALRGVSPRASLLRVSASRREALALWRSMARLEEHQIAAPRCWLFDAQSPANAWFEIDPQRGAGTAFGRGRMLASLIDRGLWCEGLCADEIDESGLALPRRLTRLRPARAREQLASWLGASSSAERPEFLRGFAQAWLGPARELNKLLATLRDV